MNEKRATVFPADVGLHLPRWSPDGKKIAFRWPSIGEPWQIYAVPADGGAPELNHPREVGAPPPTPPPPPPLSQRDETWRPPVWSQNETSLALCEKISLNNQGSAVFYGPEYAKTGQAAPGPMELYSPPLVPRGRFISCDSVGSLKLMPFFEIATQKWTELARIFVQYPTWSRDGVIGIL